MIADDVLLDVAPARDSMLPLAPGGAPAGGFMPLVVGGVLMVEVVLLAVLVVVSGAVVVVVVVVTGCSSLRPQAENRELAMTATRMSL